ncbi:phosphopantetheine-binding protein [Micromonospora tulbaghiae]|uniref:phosphopantetheine-binding protein n=1 Tax=Micromonospora tulbaghiae TaxID=479978 RepID=UPI0033DB1931
MADWPPEFDALLRRHCRLVGTDAPIRPDALLVTLGMDSLEVVEFIVAIEDAFDLVIPQEMLTPEVFGTPSSVWRTVADLRAGVAR